MTPSRTDSTASGPCAVFPFFSRTAMGSAVFVLFTFDAHAQPEEPQLQEVVVSASRAEQERFDAPAAVDVVRIDPFTQQSPLVNMSELLSGVPGLQVTFSAGLVELEAGDRTPMLLYQRADRALYRAKSEGRDRTAIG